MKRKILVSFLAGTLSATLIFGGITTALAASNTVTFNGVNLSMNGEAVFGKGEYLETSAGQQIPSSILYTDETGGGTTYLPVACISKLLNISITWDQATNTVVLGESNIIAVKPEAFINELAEKWLVNNEYPKNSKGETYGPEILSVIVGHSPDLIAAATTNGEEGYVRQSDLETYWSLSSEELDELKRSDTPYTIPVYDSEGQIIGEFRFEDGEL